MRVVLSMLTFLAGTTQTFLSILFFVLPPEFLELWISRDLLDHLFAFGKKSASANRKVQA